MGISHHTFSSLFYICVATLELIRRVVCSMESILSSSMKSWPVYADRGGRWKHHWSCPSPRWGHRRATALHYCKMGTHSVLDLSIGQERRGQGVRQSYTIHYSALIIWHRFRIICFKAAFIWRSISRPFLKWKVQNLYQGRREWLHD